jgi:hypothetical protein
MQKSSGYLETGGCRFGLEEGSEEGLRGPHPCLDPQGEPTPATVTFQPGGRGDPPTVTQAAPSLGSDSATALQKGR